MAPFWAIQLPPRRLTCRSATLRTKAGAAIVAPTRMPANPQIFDRLTFMNARVE